ncbi:MAG: hypothetical protein ACYTGB_04795, partial [Planctomycetota bacterium]
PKGRPLVYHTYQQHVWLPEEQAFYSAGVWQRGIGLWAFEPAKREWRQVGKQIAIPKYGDQSNMALTYDPGLKTVVALTNYHPAAYVFDRKKKAWAKKCDLQCLANMKSWGGGFLVTAYDSTRKVHVVTTKGMLTAKGTWGLWFTVDLAAGKTKPIKNLAEVAKDAPGKTPVTPELLPYRFGSVSMAYDPENKRTLALLNRKGIGDPGELWAYDAGKDDWSEVKMKGRAPTGMVDYNMMCYDPGHKCFLFVNALAFNGGRTTDGVYAFRLK